jgi:hypothetical protein
MRRAARLSVRFGRFALRPPRQTRTNGRETVSMSYGDRREETPPEGAQPVQWRLPTTPPKWRAYLFSCF